MTTTTTSATITRFEPDLVDEAHVAAAAYLAPYSGRTLDAYRHDLRYFFQWANDVDLDILAATRPHIETYRRCLEERGLAASTVDQRLDRRTAHRWVRSIGKRAGLGSIHPHMLRAAFIMAALDTGVPLRDVQTAARHADPRTTTIYDRRRQNFDRHAAYVVVAYVAGG